jgi:hypothetical protein
MKSPVFTLLGLLGCLAPGCRHEPVRSARTISVLPLPSFEQPARPTSTLSFPPLPEIDFSRMEGGEFIPPGATVIWPDQRISVPFHLTPKGKYPSTGESISLDGNAVVGTRSEQRSVNLLHWLRLYRRGEEQARNILSTENSLETLWSHDSQSLAISHFIGKNYAEVLVVRLWDGLKPRRVETADALVRFFAAAQLASPRFEKAYRWGDGPLLIVRGVGRQSSVPHDLFGYEVVVDTEHLNDPGAVRLIRGYVKTAPAK